MLLSKSAAFQGKRFSATAPWFGKVGELLIVMAGIVATQFILYGPSLLGAKILLPADNLAGSYLPRTREWSVRAQNPRASDRVMAFEPDRLFAAAEIKAGRFPIWTPCDYGGEPVQGPKYSPFWLLTCLTASPKVLAWAQLLLALTAGVGAYAFCRRVLEVSFWPATFIAWCYPIIAYFVLWQGYYLCGPVSLLPWLLYAVKRTIKRNALAPIGLAVITALVLVSGQLDVAGQVLLISGLYALWCLAGCWLQPGQLLTSKTAWLVVSGWSLGFLLAAPQILPTIEYVRTGHRMMARAKGGEDRPPIGITALPEIVLPDVYGSDQRGSIDLYPPRQANLPESASSAYVGLSASLLLAPLAWFNPRRRWQNLFWLGIAILGVGWSINLPGLVQILRLPGLNMMSHNRLTFATSFAVLALAATGLEALATGQVKWHRSFWFLATVLAGLFGWCLYRSQYPPEPLATLLPNEIITGKPLDFFLTVRTPEDVWAAQSWFEQHYLLSAVWCAAGLLVLLCLWKQEQRYLLPFAGFLMMGDLLCFGHGRYLQSEPALWYPPIPALREIAKAIPGRVIGFDCLSATLAQACGLRDVRGYDGVDPEHWVELLQPAIDPHSLVLPHAATQNVRPRILGETSMSSIQLSPIMDMLGVRYVVFRGDPPAGITPKFQSSDYYVLENLSALPRVFIPRHVELAASSEERLQKLARPEFDARQVAYVETPVAVTNDCRGAAKIVTETPVEITIEAQMDAPGLVVLADRWDAGWRAYLNNQRAPILEVNHVLRGVVVPSDSSRIVFRYEPASAFGALPLFMIGCGILVVWSVKVICRVKRSAVRTA